MLKKKVDVLDERKNLMRENRDHLEIKINVENLMPKVRKELFKNLFNVKFYQNYFNMFIFIDQSPVVQVDSKNYDSSGEDSVVFMDDIPPPVTIPSTPPDLSPYNSNRYEPDKPRRLEDSSSNGSSSSSSSSDSDSDYSVSSIGSRLTDKSDRSIERAPSPPVNNGYDHRKY